MLVKTDKDTVSVHLGPSWYLENQDVKIAAEGQSRSERFSDYLRGKNPPLSLQR